MDPGYLTTQIITIIGQLHGIFDEIGIPHSEREAKETEVRCDTRMKSDNTNRPLVALHRGIGNPS